jgi:nitroreductase
VGTFYPDGTVDEILHAARWAPSGDNEQPWRFEKGVVQKRPFLGYRCRTETAGP